MAITKARSVQYPVATIVAVAEGDVTTGGGAQALLSLPDGAEIIGGELVVDTAFDDTGAAVTADIGDADDPNRYTASSINVKSAGRTALSLTGYKTVGAEDLLITLNGANDNGSAGALRVMVQYIRHGRAHEVQT